MSNTSFAKLLAIKALKEGGGSGTEGYSPLTLEEFGQGILWKTYTTTPSNNDYRIRKSGSTTFWEKFYDPLGAIAYEWHQVSDIEIPDVTQNNDLLSLYLRGNENIENSVRLHIENGVTKLQKLIGENWANASFQSGSATILLGDDVSVGGIGHHLKISAKSMGANFIAIQVPFDNTGTGEIGTSVMGEKQIRGVTQSNDTGEWSGTKLTYTVPIGSNNVVDKVYYRIGSIPATKSIIIKLYREIEDYEHKFFEGVIPTARATVNTEVDLTLLETVGFNAGFNMIVVMESAATFSLKINAAGTSPWFARDYWVEHHEYIPHWHTWEAGEYESATIIVQSGVLYVCQEDGEQIGTFTTNLSLGKWKSLEDVLSGIGDSDSNELQFVNEINGGSILDTSNCFTLNGGSLSDTSIGYIFDCGNIADIVATTCIDGGTF